MLSHEGAVGDHLYWVQSNDTNKLDTAFLPKTLQY
jgi:hypothetical protein